MQNNKLSPATSNAPTRNARRRLGALALVAGLAMLTVACGDDDGTGPSGSGGSGSGTGGMGAGGMGTGGTGGGTGGSGGMAALELTEIAGNFIAPESAVWDPATSTWYVASFGQDVDPVQMVPDAPGFISRVAADGTLLEERYVEMPGDFLGMSVLDGILYVGHGSDLVAIDLSDGSSQVIAIPGAVFLNDVAVGNGALYISDTITNMIHRYTPGTGAEVFSTDPALAAPNGLYVDGDKVIVGTIGAFPPDPNMVGRLYELDANGAATQLGTIEGVFDGVEKVGERYLVTDFRGPMSLIDPATGEAELVADLVQDYGLGSAADIGVDTATGTVLVPDLFDDKAYLLTLP